MTLKSVARNKTGNAAEAFESARVSACGPIACASSPPLAITNYYIRNISSKSRAAAALRQANRLRITTLNGRRIPAGNARASWSEKRICQLACKPGSVRLRLSPERGSHSSGTGLAPGLLQPTRMTGPETGWSACALRVIPIRFCSRWGLPCRPCRHARGGLLPHPFTLTFQGRRFAFCGTFPGVAPAGRYPAPCFRGARTFLTLRPFGPCKARLPGQLAGAD